MQHNRNGYPDFCLLAPEFRWFLSYSSAITETLNSARMSACSFTGDGIVAETLDRFIKNDLPFVDLHTLRLHGISDVHGSHGTEEFALFAGLGLDDDGESSDPVGFRGRLFFHLANAVRDHLLRMIHGVKVIGRCLNSLLIRHQEIPGIAVRNLDKVAYFAQFVDVFP